MTKEKKSAPRAYIKLNNVSHTVHSERTPKAILDVVQRIPIVDRAPTYVTRRVDGARRRLTDPLRIWFTLPSVSSFSGEREEKCERIFHKDLNNEKLSRRSRSSRSEQRKKRFVKTNKFSFCVRAAPTWGGNLVVVKQKFEIF